LRSKFPSLRIKPNTFLKFTSRRSIDVAIVSVSSVITVEKGICKDASIVLGAVAPTPVRAMKAEQTMKGKTINAAMAAEAADLGANPLSTNSYNIKITKNTYKKDHTLLLRFDC
jgi:CO/xanthine dehydrogenase FAD-binding subunit